LRRERDGESGRQPDGEEAPDTPHS
jgi:hypothetical protein